VGVPENRSTPVSAVTLADESAAVRWPTIGSGGSCAARSDSSDGRATSRKVNPLKVAQPLIDNAMNCATYPNRVLVTGLLAASWAAAAFGSPILPRYLRPSAAQQPPIHKCCCGCKDCRCRLCRCKESVPQEVPAIPPVRSNGNDECKPLLLCNWVAMANSLSGGAGDALRPMTASRRPPCDPTLQSQHVRIQT